MSISFANFILFFYTLLANTAYIFAGHNYPLDCPASMAANFRWTTTPAQLLAAFSGHSRLHEWQVLRSSAVDLSEPEDIPETTHPVTETGNHGRHPKLPSEPQTGIAANEIVVTTREFELPV